MRRGGKARRVTAPQQATRLQQSWQRHHKRVALSLRPPHALAGGRALVAHCSCAPGRRPAACWCRHGNRAPGWRSPRESESGSAARVPVRIGRCGDSGILLSLSLSLSLSLFLSLSLSLFLSLSPSLPLARVGALETYLLSPPPHDVPSLGRRRPSGSSSRPTPRATTSSRSG
jgi:hypothetical protein